MFRDAISKIKKAFSREKTSQSRQKVMAAFRRRYLSFKSLLQANADLAEIMARLNQCMAGEISLETSEVRKLSRRTAFLATRMAGKLNDISDGRYLPLIQKSESIGARIEKELRTHTRGDVAGVTLPLGEVDASMAYIVGGKSANLGELRNYSSLPVPRGFCVTIKAGTIMLLRNGDLFKNIYSHLSKIDEDRPHTIKAAARAIHKLIQAAPVPPALLDPVLEAWDETFGKDRDTVRAALRSSAVAEDGVQSFAGQYESVLGITRSELPQAIKTVIGSLYSERALAYRAAHGYALDATGMGLCCLEMINARAAGVAFSRHPVDLRSSNVLINSAFGLGEMVVDGAGVSDQWEISRASGKIRKKTVAHKDYRLAPGDSSREWHPVPVPLEENLKDQPSITDEEAMRIAEMTLALERHYQYPQDVEWAIDDAGQIFLLQARPLGFDCASADYNGEECALLLEGAPKPLLSGGNIAARGIACGKIIRVHPNEDLGHFPEGSILLTENSSPNIMPVLRRAGGLIAQTGSLTGHMASLCREFGIPAIINLPGAISTLSDGELVTLDAIGGNVFAGEIKPLLELKLEKKQTPPKNSPAHVLLRRVAPYILPLHLIDPRSELFSPENCASIHDIMRYAHEKSYAEMFQLSDSLSGNGSDGGASKLVAPIPLDLYVIDLVDGLKDPHKKIITPADVTSRPFSMLLKGMLNPDVAARGPRPINMRGFLSVMGQSLAGGNLMAGERFGDRSYAIVSDKYLNFSSRIGYHYAILDTWCGDTVNKNYIRFEFAGGAAGDIQRERRARCIGIILNELGFNVERENDRIRARFQKYPEKEIASRLDQLGRLLITSRQMDMLMVNEEAVTAFADNFLNGVYH